MWAKWLHKPCRLGGPQIGEDSNWIHGPFHIGDRQQMHHLWGEEAQKGKCN